MVAHQNEGQTIPALIGHTILSQTMMQRINQKLKSSFVTWLMREFQTRQVQRTVATAEIASTAQLGPEAQIENNAGGKERILIGEHSFVRGRLLTYGHGGHISIGRWCYVGVHTEIWSMESIEIGDRVLIAHQVNIHDGTAHSLDAVQRHDHFRHIIERGHPRSSELLPGVRSAPIIIEDDVWISFGVTILKGVRIGAGSVIAANSLVTGDVPSGMLYRCDVTPVLEPIRGKEFSL